MTFPRGGKNGRIDGWRFGRSESNGIEATLALVLD
jgi:hypothetical protein